MRTWNCFRASLWSSAFPIALLVALQLRFCHAADYVADPLAGSMSNPGTADKPWGSLEEVLRAKKPFKGGDRILLRRGNHGGPVITGSGEGASETSRVTILPEPGHTPVMRRLMFSGARFWRVQDVIIHAEIPGNDKGDDDSQPGGRNGLLLFRGKSMHNQVVNSGFWATQHPWGWAADEKGWGGSINGLFVDIGGGSHNLVEKCHFLNVANGLSFNAPDNTATHCVVENYIIDGVRPNAPRTRVHYSTIMNSVMNDHSRGHGGRQHRDMCQAIGANKDQLELLGNIWIPVADPAMPICRYDEVSKTKYMEVGAPVIAGWDGPFIDWRVENNVIFTAHTTAIWLNGASNCQILNNTVVRLGDHYGHWSPGIRIIQLDGKGGNSRPNIVCNNISAGEITVKNNGPAPVNAATQNISVKGKQASSFFVATNPGFDARLKSATGAMGRANRKYMPELDATGTKRRGADMGAYAGSAGSSPDKSAPSAPGKPVVVVIPGLGADLQWTPAKDKSGVAGYDIYRNKVLVGRTRAGERYFDLFACSTTALKGKEDRLSYSIRAFDAARNGTMGASGSPVQPALPAKTASTQ